MVQKLLDRMKELPSALQGSKVPVAQEGRPLPGELFSLPLFTQTERLANRDLGNWQTRRVGRLLPGWKALEGGIPPD